MKSMTSFKKLAVGCILCVLFSIQFCGQTFASTATYLNVYPVQIQEKIYSFTCEASQYYIYFSVDGDWTATTNADWITLDKTSGSGSGAFYIAASIAENKSGAARSGNITISAGALSSTVSMWQDHLPPYLNIGYYENSTCPAWGGSLYIGVTSNTYWSVSDDAGFVDYVSKTYGGYGSDTCLAVLPQNNTGRTRTVHFTFTAGGKVTKTITVIQPSM